MMNDRKQFISAEADKMSYDLARGYLSLLISEGVSDILVNAYLTPIASQRPDTKQGLYLRILESAQNANMKAGVIGRSIGGVSKLASVLEGFDPSAVIMKFGNNSQIILDEVVETVNPRGQIRRTPRSIWPLYCKTILSAAVFVQQFSTVNDFFSWVDFFNQDDRARASLPMLLGHEIKGFGFALSCDFLKELGYVDFPKPDVHLREIFTALGLLGAGCDDYQLFKAIVRVARNAGVTPYNADKTFWLIGSGYFYDHPNIGKNGRIGSHKQDFIEFARSQLAKVR